MAQLKDTVVSGSLRATDTLYSTTAQFQILRAPTASNGTTYGPGTNGNFLKSNGTSIYWVSLVAADIPNISTDKLTSGTLPVGRGGTGQTSIANIQAGKDGDGNTISSTYLKLSGGTLTGILHITPATGEGGELRLNAATSEVTKNSIILDNYYGAFRIFGGASADGTTRTGAGTPLVIDPYDKTITGGYTITGNLTGTASKATADADGNTISSTYLKLSGGTITGTLTVNSTLTQAANQVFSAGGSIEMHPATTSNFGGFIDFHYNNSTEDYTTRIIESDARTLTIKARTGARGYLNLVAESDHQFDLGFGRSSAIKWALSSRNSSEAFFGLYNHVKSAWSIKVEESTHNIITSGQLQVTNGSGNGIKIWKNDEGGNIRIYGKDDTSYYELDSYDSTSFRIVASNTHNTSAHTLTRWIDNNTTATQQLYGTSQGYIQHMRKVNDSGYHLGSFIVFNNSGSLSFYEYPTDNTSGASANREYYNLPVPTAGRTSVAGFNILTTKNTVTIGQGGTGLTASPSMLTNLGSTTAANVLQASPRPGITGTLGTAHGGTGRTSWSASQVIITDANGALSQTASVPVTRGGTGATDAATARSNLSVTQVIVLNDSITDMSKAYSTLSTRLSSGETAIIHLTTTALTTLLGISRTCTKKIGLVTRSSNDYHFFVNNLAGYCISFSISSWTAANTYSRGVLYTFNYAQQQDLQAHG